MKTYYDITFKSAGITQTYRDVAVGSALFEQLKGDSFEIISKTLSK